MEIKVVLEAHEAPTGGKKDQLIEAAEGAVCLQFFHSSKNKKPASSGTAGPMWYGTTKG